LGRGKEPEPPVPWLGRFRPEHSAALGKAQSGKLISGACPRASPGAGYAGTVRIGPVFDFCALGKSRPGAGPTAGNPPTIGNFWFESFDGRGLLKSGPGTRPTAGNPPAIRRGFGWDQFGRAHFLTASPGTRPTTGNPPAIRLNLVKGLGRETAAREGFLRFAKQLIEKDRVFLRSLRDLLQVIFRHSLGSSDPVLDNSLKDLACQPPSEGLPINPSYNKLVRC